MADSKGLNPQAAEYIPILSRETSCQTDDAPSVLAYHSIVSAISTPIVPQCYYPQPELHLYFNTLPSPSYSPHLYATPCSTHPQPPDFLPQPPRAVAPLPATEYPPPAPATVLSSSLEHRASRRGGKREGGFFGGHERAAAAKPKWKPKFDRTVGTRDVPKKSQHQVLHLKCDEAKTTVMIKNIPSKYTRELLLKFLEQYCMSENQRAKAEKSEERVVSAFDFIYLPIDFGTGCNKGYGFVNFTDPRAVWKFYRAFHQKTWDFFQSPKIREIVCAKIQGKEALVKHFSGSTFQCESDDFLPVWFSPPKDGSGEPVKPTTVGRRIPTITGPFRETRKPSKSR